MMSETTAQSSAELRRLVVGIVAAFVGHNRLAIDELPAVIETVYGSLLDQQQGNIAQILPDPAVAVKKSVTRNHIVCLEDGKKFKSLKRHLRTAHGMTPEDYRVRWSLRSDYPLVAPNYAAQRSELAKSIGLGRKSDKTTKATKAAKTNQPARAKPAKNGRKAVGRPRLKKVA